MRRTWLLQDSQPLSSRHPIPSFRNTARQARGLLSRPEYLPLNSARSRIFRGSKVTHRQGHVSMQSTDLPQRRLAVGLGMCTTATRLQPQNADHRGSQAGTPFWPLSITTPLTVTSQKMVADGMHMAGASSFCSVVPPGPLPPSAAVKIPLTLHGPCQAHATAFTPRCKLKCPLQAPGCCPVLPLLS